MIWVVGGGVIVLNGISSDDTDNYKRRFGWITTKTSWTGTRNRQ